MTSLPSVVKRLPSALSVTFKNKKSKSEEEIVSLKRFDSLSNTHQSFYSNSFPNKELYIDEEISKFKKFTLNEIKEEEYINSNEILHLEDSNKTNENNEIFDFRDLNMNVINNKSVKNLKLDKFDENNQNIKDITSVGEPKSLTVADNSLTVSRIFTLDIRFNNLVFKLKNNKVILNDITGHFKHSKLTAIMGGSGCGKSTLISCLLSKTLFYGKLRGNIFINGKKDNNLLKYKDLIGFVPQNNVMNPYLTVKQLLYFNAKLRLDKSKFNKNYKIEKYVNKIISLLDLNKIKDNIIGGVGTKYRGLSGGESRRVNIGMELVSNPSLLFLDEPTTGLDTTTSYFIIKLLKHLTKYNNTTVIVVLHQPRYEIFKKFDELLLLNKTGKIIYNGPVSKCVHYFQNLGFRLKKHTNPADYVVDISYGIIKSTYALSDNDIVWEWQKYYENSKNKNNINTIPHTNTNINKNFNATSESRIIINKQITNLNLSQEISNPPTIVNKKENRDSITVSPKNASPNIGTITEESKIQSNLRFSMDLSNPPKKEEFSITPSPKKPSKDSKESKNDIEMASIKDDDKKITVDFNDDPFFVPYKKRIQINMIEQIILCLWREYIILKRQYLILLRDIILIIALGVLTGTISQIDGFTRLVSIPFLITLSYVLFVCISTLHIYNDFKLIYYREVSSGLNNVSYFMSITISSLIYIGLYPIIYLISYFYIATKIRDMRGSFIKYYIVLTIITFSMQGLAHFLSIMFVKQKATINTLSIVLLLVLLCGYIPSLESYHSSFVGRAIVSLNPCRWILEGIYLVEAIEQLNTNCEFTYVKMIVYYYDNNNWKGWTIEYSQYWKCVIVISIFGVIFRVLTYIALKYNNREKQL